MKLLSKKRLTAIFCGCLLAYPIAAETSATPAPSVAPPAYDGVLELAPDDAWLVLYAEQVDAAIRSPLGQLAAMSHPAVGATLSLIERSIDGPVMLSVSGPPINPFLWQYRFATRSTLTPDAWLTRLAGEVDKFQPVVDELPMLAGVTLEHAESTGRLTVVGVVGFSLSIVARDGMFFGSTTPGETDLWLTRADASAQFVKGDVFQAITDGKPDRVASLMYVDSTAFAPALAGPINQEVPKLFEALQLDHVRYLALLRRAVSDATDAGREPVAHAITVADQTVQVVPMAVRVAVGFDVLEPGLWRLQASKPGRVTLARVFPPRTNVFVHGSMDRASGMVDDIAAFARCIDPVMEEEYRQEVAEFKRDVGFDPHTMFLGNLVDEWAYGVTVPNMGSAVLAVRLADPKLFVKHMRQLRQYFQLEVHSRVHRGVSYTQADRKAGPFYYAQYDDLLIVSPHEEAVVASIDALLDDQSLSKQAFYKAACVRAPDVSSKFVFADVGDLARLAIEEEDGKTSKADPGYGYLSSLAEDGAAVVMTVKPIAGPAMAVDFVAAGEGCPDPWEQVQRVVATSLAASREQSRRASSMATVRSICKGVYVYVEANKESPQTLQDIVDAGCLGSAAEAAQLLVGPYGGAEGTTFYLYRNAGPLDKVDPLEPIVSEREVHNGGMVVGFADGHAEWVTSPDAERYLAIMTGANK